MSSRCPRCHTELVHAKVRPEVIPLGADGVPLPGPYQFCMVELLVISLATGDPEVIGSLG